MRAVCNTGIPRLCIQQGVSLETVNSSKPLGKMLCLEMLGLEYVPAPTCVLNVRYTSRYFSKLGTSLGSECLDFGGVWVFLFFSLKDLNKIHCCLKMIEGGGNAGTACPVRVFICQ